MDLKSTINLPKTGFPMKAGLPQNEPKILARWEEQRIYDRIREVRKGAPTYVLHDGPPYANGPIHLGTAMNKCLKDFIVKSKNMAGFDSPYVPGWDCHGLPIEIKVDQMLGGKKLQMAAVDVRAECRKYAEKFLDLQRSQFKRIGVFGRFDQPYSTMTPQYEAAVLGILYRFLENDFVYKGLRPVYWCMFDETALAEAEVEYENHTSPTVWVKYPFAGDPAALDPALKGKKVSTIIWTTTPWTLPASMAVAFHPEEEYVALEYEDDVFIVGARLAAVVQEKTGLQSAREIARFLGRKMEYTEFRHPFLDRKIVGVLADYVTMDQGTGVVHTAPAHGAEDFFTGQKYKIDPTCNVDKAGILRHGLPEYEGKRVFDANASIIELLKSRGVLLHSEKMEHSYPHCWRCHNPVIFRATEQWFIGMETPMKPPPKGSSSSPGTTSHETTGETMRSRTLHEIAKVKWDPAWGEERISNMIATRPDWCISRQRVWGVPIAVFLCDACGKPVNDPHINRWWCNSFRSMAPTPGMGPMPMRFFRLATSALTAAAPNSKKKLTFSMCGSSRDQAMPLCLATNRIFPGPPIFISRAATSIVDGFILPCSARSATKAALHIAWSRPADGRSTSRAAPCRSRSATRSIPSRSLIPSAARSCACG
jgi:isoleucyl-tRNA synthetase